MSFLANFSLGLYKLVIGLIGGSAALVADAVHSFSDVIGSTSVLVATKVSAKAPDKRYPYGRGKAEFMGAIFVYTLLVFLGAGISYTAIRAMMNPHLRAPHFVTLVGAAISVFQNYLMYRYGTCVGRRNNSPAILADAFEFRADAISSAACILGIIGGMLVHPIFDPIAALLVGVIIFWNCQEQLREAIRGLMDAGLPKAELDVIREIALKREGVKGVSFLRTRQTGARYWIDVGIEVTGDLDVSQADILAMSIRDELKSKGSCHHAEVYVSPAIEVSTLLEATPEGAPC